MIHSRSARISAALALVAAVLIGGGLLMTGGEDANRSEPSYAALRPLLQEGAGKDELDGDVEVFQIDNPDPTAWIKVFKIPGTGTFETFIVKHRSFLEKGDGEPIPTTYKSIEGPGPTTLQAFLGWIVENYGHVESLSDLVPEPLD